jgi:hypothetical protein
MRTEYVIPLAVRRVIDVLPYSLIEFLYGLFVIHGLNQSEKLYDLIFRYFDPALYLFFVNETAYCCICVTNGNGLKDALAKSGHKVCAIGWRVTLTIFCVVTGLVPTILGPFIFFAY